jgi:hypothetical protein
MHDHEDKQEQLFDKNIDLKKFNEAFDRVHKRDNDLVLHNGVPLAWNSGSSLVYTPINNLEQIYAEEETLELDPIGATYYSNIDYGKQQNKISKEEVSKLTGASYVDSHNIKDENYHSEMKKRLSERLNDTNSFNGRKLSDFKKDDTAGYGIMEQIGIKQYDRITLDDVSSNDIQVEFDRLMKERSRSLT